MRKLSLTVFTVICALCLALGIGITTNASKASAENASGATPTLSSTKIMRSDSNDKMLLATAIKGYGDVYEVGYTFTGSVNTISAVTNKYYTAISNGTTTWTPADIFSEDWVSDDDVGMIIWEISFSVGTTYEYKPYALVGERNENNQLVIPSEEVRVTPETSSTRLYHAVTLQVDSETPYGTLSKTSVVAKDGAAVSVADNVITIDGVAVTATAASNTAEYTYAFNGFTGYSATVTANATVTASFTRTLNEYSVKFVNYDGTELQSETVAYGTTPVYNGATPVKPATAQYTYTFNGWDKEIVSVTGETTYTATYTSTVNNYTIAWSSADGTVTKDETIAYGESYTFPWTTFAKASDGTYVYDMSVEKSTDGGENYVETGTILAGGDNLSEYNANLDAVTGSVLYKVTYVQTSPVRVVKDNGNDGYVVSQTGNTFTFAGVSSENVNKFYISSDLIKYKYAQGSRNFKVIISVAENQSATFTANAYKSAYGGDSLGSISGTDSVTLPVYAMTESALSEINYFVGVTCTDNSGSDALDKFIVTVSFDDADTIAATAAIAGIRTLIDDSVECSAEIDAANNAYNALNAEQKVWVNNSSTLADANAIIAVKSAITNIKSLNSSFSVVTLENYLSLTNAVSAIESEISSLDDALKARIAGYTQYSVIGSSFTVVENMRGTDLFDRVIVGGTGVTSTTNADISGNSVLIHATYGHCISIGKTNGSVKISYNASAAPDLSGYNYVLIGIRNGTNAAQNWSLGDTSDYLAQDVPANMSSTGEFVTLRLTVEQFLSKEILTWQGGGNIWVAPIIAVKVDSVMAAEIESFNSSFTGVTLENHLSVISSVNSVESCLSSLSEEQREYLVPGYSEYAENKNSFLIVDDMSGTDIASRFNLGAGSNGINNGETAPNIAADLKDATYGACATIGKNSNGLEIKYSDSAKEGLDLSGYSKVLIGVKNRLVGGLNITTISGRALAENVAYDTFAVLELTVDEFLNSGIAIYVTTQGSVWLTSIIAVK